MPEKRAKYNAKRRQKDLDFVYSNWNLPKEMTDATINIADVPAKVAKVRARLAFLYNPSCWAESCMFSIRCMVLNLSINERLITDPS